MSQFARDFPRPRASKSHSGSSRGKRVRGHLRAPAARRLPPPAVRSQDQSRETKVRSQHRNTERRTNRPPTAHQRGHHPHRVEGDGTWRPRYVYSRWKRGDPRPTRLANPGTLSCRTARVLRRSFARAVRRRINSTKTTAPTTDGGLPVPQAQPVWGTLLALPPST